MENNLPTPLVDNDYLLQKFKGKGGWIHVAFPEIKQDKRSYFGLVKVRGRIDNYEISNANLMPVGDGTMFLAVNSEIRKQIGKNEGDMVHVTLYSLELPPVDTEDFFICLQDEPAALERFNRLPENEQQKLLEWIYSVKNDQLKVERIAQTIDRLNNYHL